MFLLKWIDRIKFWIFRKLLHELMMYRPCYCCPFENTCGPENDDELDCFDIHSFLLDAGKRVWITDWEEI